MVSDTGVRCRIAGFEAISNALESGPNLVDLLDLTLVRDDNLVDHGRDAFDGPGRIVDHVCELLDGLCLVVGGRGDFAVPVGSLGLSVYIRAVLGLPVVTNIEVRRSQDFGH